MGSKLPTDLFPAPIGESQNAKLGNEGRQLRSRLVEASCKLCGKPLATTAGKSSTSHAHCTCVTPPGPSTGPHFTASASPRKKKIHVKVGESSKRQLFKEESPSTMANIPQPQEIVEGELGGGCSAAFAATTHEHPDIKIEVKSEEDESTPNKTGSSSSSSSKSRHPCTRCPKSFNTPGKLAQHMFSHTGEKPFVCSHCAKAFSSKFKLVRHLLIHSDLKQYRCTMCERTFHRKDHLKNHSKVHSPVKRRYTCDRAECKKEYSSILSYRKHMAVHSAQEGNLECKICGEVCASKEEILNHLKVHAGSRSFKTPADRKYHCDYCPRSFFTGKDVRRHSVVHTGRRDFLCQFCPQRFGRKDHLTRHIKKSHSNSAKKVKTKRTADPERSKSIGNILQEMFDKKVACSSTTATATVTATATATSTATVTASSSSQQLSSEQQSSMSQSVSDDLYKMQGLDSPVDVTKLESSPDIVPIVALDEKNVLPTKVEDNLGLYDLPIIDTNIPVTKFEPYHHPFETYPVPDAYSQPGPSTSTMMPDLMSYEQTQQPSPYPSNLTATFDPESVQVKTEVEYVPQVDESSTLDLVLPAITNISSSVGECMLSNAELQNFLTQHPEATDMGGGGEDEHSADRNIDDQFLNLLPTLPNSELLASLLSSADPQINSDPLPHFDQAFHHSP